MQRVRSAVDLDAVAQAWCLPSHVLRSDSREVEMRAFMSDRGERDKVQRKALHTGVSYTEAKRLRAAIECDGLHATDVLLNTEPLYPFKLALAESLAAFVALEIS